jgi:hypothetical protein
MLLVEHAEMDYIDNLNERRASSGSPKTGTRLSMTIKNG